MISAFVSSWRLRKRGSISCGFFIGESTATLLPFFSFPDAIPRKDQQEGGISMKSGRIPQPRIVIPAEGSFCSLVAVAALLKAGD